MPPKRNKAYGECSQGHQRKIRKAVAQTCSTVMVEKMGVVPTMIVYKDPLTDKNSVIKVSDSEESAESDVKQLYINPLYIILNTQGC